MASGNLPVALTGTLVGLIGVVGLICLLAYLRQAAEESSPAISLVPQIMWAVGLVGAASFGVGWGLVSAQPLAHWRNSTTLIARGDVSRLIRIGVRPFEGPPRHAVIAVDAASLSLFALGGAYDASAIARALSVPLIGSFDDVMSLREVSREYPGAARSPLADPLRLLVFSAVGTVVIGVIAFVVWTALRS